MKNTTLIVLSAVLSVNIAFAQQQGFLQNVYQYIEDPTVFALNQEPGHTPLMFFRSVDEALENNWSNSGSFLSLNGMWKFKWSENPHVSPTDFFTEKFNDSKWDNLIVPSNWEMHGYGDPVFRNISQPFVSNPPLVPRDYNPVGSYRNTFTLPTTWKEKEVFLRMEGTSSASFIWINGQEVGYNQRANEPAEYSISKFLKPGKNLIAVNVYN
jgi:beta-galactosidase